MQPIFRPTDQTIDYRPEGGDKTVVNQADTDTNSSLGNVSVSSPPGYEIRKELGRGGMGIVYLARQKALARDVALKMILSGDYSSDTDRQRFLSEAEAVASVSHPNIVQIYDLGTYKELPFFALEYCPGGSLAQRLNGIPLPATEAAELIEKLARAMISAHSKGIIHRDLKPANILLGADLSPKITDFGLARRTESAAGLTQSGAILGTPSYMAPEQAGSDLNAIGPVTDVYSLGSILYECLTGRPPFRAATTLETVRQVLQNEPVPPSRLVPGLPRDLETICLKALQKLPGNRYPDCTQLAEDLRRFRNGESILARPASSREKTIKFARRHPTFTALMFASLFGLGIIIGIVSNANLRLQKERDAVNQQKEVAQKERDKAERRLQLAIDAVERMMTRMANEKWARNPELKEERKQVLQEAIDVYKQFLNEDSLDLRLRRTSANANFKIGSTYLSMGEVDKAKEYLEEARKMTSKLVDEFPQSAENRRDLAMETGFLGHCLMLDAQFEEGMKNYQKMVEISEKILADYPDDEPSREVLIEALNYLAISRSGNQNESLRAFGRVLTEVQKLMERPSPSYNARLNYILARMNIAMVQLRAKLPGQANTIRKLIEQIDELAKEPAPSAYVAQIFETLQVQRYSVEAILDEKEGKVSDALQKLDKVQDLMKGMLRREPRNFPIRTQYLTLLQLRLGIISRANMFDREKSTLAELNREADAMLQIYPRMYWIPQQILNFRSTLLIEKVKSGHFENFESDLTSLEQDISDGQPAELQDALRYNLACIFSQHYGAITTENRALSLDRAMDYLKSCRARGYFKSEQNLKLLDEDSDIDPIRKEKKYLEFRDSLR
ncbi:protein kinase [Telmatocola sphagniphila]|uniref:non-specific serine/threonine protein kinase n=1 Tax=Telmatocola sphagniphila TaxID=1123043 RepID=A0A8E6EVE9_9BACT|nr:serine/threonine-protein kinase [Telmatocola sphagniphila]QVL32635.1 protein kinase [Telmatocola sphagniphila]